MPEPIDVEDIYRDLAQINRLAGPLPDSPRHAIVTIIFVLQAKIELLARERRPTLWELLKEWVRGRK